MINHLIYNTFRTSPEKIPVLYHASPDRQWRVECTHGSRGTGGNRICAGILRVICHFVNFYFHNSKMTCHLKVVGHFLKAWKRLSSSRIITRILFFKQDIKSALDAPRLNHQLFFRRTWNMKFVHKRIDFMHSWYISVRRMMILHRYMNFSIVYKKFSQ